MAEEEKKEGEEKPEKKPSNLMGILIPVISSAVTAAIVGLVVVFVLAPKPEATAPAGAEGGHAPAAEAGHGGGSEHGAAAESAPAKDEFSEEEFDPYAKKKHTGKYFQYDPLTISIFDREKVHYLRLKVVFELGNDEVKDELSVKDPQIKDSLIFVLGDFTVRELLDNQAKLLVKEVLLKTLNRLLGKGKVVDIYFTEFVVQ